MERAPGHVDVLTRAHEAIHAVDPEHESAFEDREVFVLLRMTVIRRDLRVRLVAGLLLVERAAGFHRSLEKLDDDTVVVELDAHQALRHAAQSTPRRPVIRPAEPSESPL